MAIKKINELTSATTLADNDLVPFWDTSEEVTSYITVANLAQALSTRLGTNGMIVLEGGIYYRYKMDLQGIWTLAEEIGPTLP